MSSKLYNRFNYDSNFVKNNSNKTSIKLNFTKQFSTKHVDRHLDSMFLL